MNETCPLGCLVYCYADEPAPWTGFILSQWTWNQDTHQVMADAIIWSRERKLTRLKRWCIPCQNLGEPLNPKHPQRETQLWKIVKLEGETL